MRKIVESHARLVSHTHTPERREREKFYEQKQWPSVGGWIFFLRQMHQFFTAPRATETNGSHFPRVKKTICYCCGGVKTNDEARVYMYTKE